MFFDDLARHGPRCAFATADGVSISYSDLSRNVQSFAAALGPERQLVFLEIDNTIAALTAYLGCLAGGHPVHPVAPGQDAKLEALVARYRPNRLVSFPHGACKVTRFDETPHALHPDLRLLLSTSGSTGSPKFVKLSGRNIQSNAESICAYLRLDATERAITTLKPSYSYGLSVLHAHLQCGGSLLLTDLSVSQPDFWTLFEQAGATSFAGVPYTFEVIEQTGFALSSLSRLRYATQAGGRLDPARVSRLARQSQAQGWRFYVMYGQTEAAPRIAYLDPQLAADHPQSIGTAIPGGRIALLDADGHDIDQAGVPGELAYAGPNVMMGYAESSQALASDETPAILRTGDLAVRDANGLFSIVGRLGRFVKPFGLRINLDDVERAAGALVPGAVATGNDDRIIVAIPAGASAKATAMARTLAATFGLPAYVVHVIVRDPLPRLESGKVDYRRLLDENVTGDAPAAAAGSAGPKSFLRIVTSRAFYRTALDEALDILGLRQQSWGSVQQIYETFLGQAAADTARTFSQLTGDSLSYVQISLALEEYLGALPPGWEHLSQDDLEALREQPATF